jgi:hypothetical protein
MGGDGLLCDHLMTGCSHKYGVESVRIVGFCPCVRTCFSCCSGEALGG